MIRETRPRSIDKALAAFNAALPRQGRIARQCKRAFIVSNGQPVSMRELRERWCYPPRKSTLLNTILNAPARR